MQEVPRMQVSVGGITEQRKWNNLTSLLFVLEKIDWDD